ncbi:DUF2207 domain-containing protein, partial [bacterium]|nr:DUF2207 domain-containing protein [bacterium]
IFPIAAIIMLFGMYSKIGTKKGMIFPAIFALLYGGVPLLSVLTMNQAALERNFGTFLYCIAGLIIIGICLYQLPKRNKQGIKMLGHILGFKKFLETAEAHKIQELVKINPEYCFNVLPYAYVLGVSDAWIKKFESAINYPPDWYKGNFNTITFNNLTSAIHDVSTPSVSNGGISTSSSGGGGCSGGGSGGGGGGSW